MIFGLLIYYFIGFIIVNSMKNSKQMSASDGRVTVMYTLGSMIWPILILISLIVFIDTNFKR